jgi:hypothetical protein
MEGVEQTYWDNKLVPMKTPKNIDVLFVAGFGPIVRDPAASRNTQ